MRPNGEIGGSGLPDPKIVIEQGVKYHYDEGAIP